MTRVGPAGTDTTGCAKRLWVMTTLSDDELASEAGSLPQGLRFHLSQCESCRVLAESLLSVSQGLSELSAVEPPDELGGRADLQAREALRAGAMLTGRVDIPDELEREFSSGGLRRWRRYAWYAAAAVILFSVGLVWVSTRTDSRRRVVVEKPEGIAVEPIMAVRPEAEGRDEEVATALLRAQSGSAVADAEAGGADKSEPGSPDDDLTAPRHARLGSVASPIGVKGHRHHSHVEAALCEDPRCVGRGYILPNLSERLIGIGPAFDTSLPVGSTDDPTKLLGDE